MDEAPLCCADLSSLLDVLSNGDGSASVASELVIGFCRANTLLDRSHDFTSSLVLMTADERWRLRADLQTSPGLNSLPLLERTGTSAPLMYGHLLGYDDHIVTDARLQRARCLFLTAEAAQQERIELILSVARLVRASEIFPAEILQSMSDTDPRADKRWWNQVRDALRRTHEHRGSDERWAEAVSQEIKTLLKVFEPSAPLSEGILNYRDRVVGEQRRIPGTSPRSNDGQDSRLRDFLRALALAAEDKPYKRRHLGPDRLDRMLRHGQNIVIQGAGDLSMNRWNVAFYRTPTNDRGEDVAEADDPHVLIPPAEPYAARTYHCLVAWREDARPGTRLERAIGAIEKDGTGGPLGGVLGKDLAITALRVSPGRPYIQLPDSDLHRSHVPEFHKLVEFAIYGKLILRRGEIVERIDVVDEFDDLRHIFVLPNLNPESAEKWRPDAENRKHLGRRPRDIFGQLQPDDVWLLEKALLADRNLRHLACASTIAVDLARLGAPRDWIDYCLSESKYNDMKHVRNIAQRGHYAWDDMDFANPTLHIRLRFNSYPCTIVGIGNPKRRAAIDTLYLLAWGHNFATGHTIWECARILKEAGAQYALVIDEGRDVFQCFLKDVHSRFGEQESAAADLRGNFKVPIVTDVDGTILRRSMRASLAFWHEAS